MKLGEIESALRALNEWSFEAVAERATAAGQKKVAWQSIQQLEQNPDMTPRYLRQLASAFGKSTDELFAWRPGMPHFGPNEIERGSRDTKPISNGDATHTHDDQNALRRVRIMGAVQMDADGYWVEGDAEAETYAYRTEDQGAYAIRILSQRFQPVLASGQCVIVSPAADLKPGRHALVVLADGRRTVRTFHSHEHGIWHFTSITDANVYLDLEDAAVTRVDRVMGFVWTD